MSVPTSPLLGAEPSSSLPKPSVSTSGVEGLEGKTLMGIIAMYYCVTIYLSWLLPAYACIANSNISLPATQFVCAAPDDNFDWSSVEQVTSLVSKTTLAGLQQQWKQHAGSMDQYGRSFAENMYNMHSQVIKVCSF